MRFDPPPQSGRPPLHCPEVISTEEVPQDEIWLAPTHSRHTHLGVSVSGSESVPSASLSWNRPSQCPVSCAAMYPVWSGPQAMESALAVHLVVSLISAEETMAPLW